MLDPAVERPELRHFETNPLDIARRERGQLVAAGLTLLRAYQVAGRPVRSPPMGSFEAWSSIVRDALIWAGEPDVAEGMETARAVDQRLAALGSMITVLSDAFGSERMTSHEVAEAAGVQINGKYERPELRGALLAVAGERDRINIRRLGIWLGTNAGRIAGGRRIVADAFRSGLPTWRIEVVERFES